MFPVFEADPAWQSIDLLSDVHLHADQRHTFAAWRDHLLGTPADAVLMLGDLFKVWVGDDARHGTFEAQCLAVLQAASRQRVLAFMPGNRDFLIGDCAGAGHRILTAGHARGAGRAADAGRNDERGGEHADSPHHDAMQAIADVGFMFGFFHVPRAQARCDVAAE